MQDAAQIAADATAEIGRTTVAKVGWRLLPFVLLLYVVAWLDRVNIGFAALQMNKDLGFDDAVYGFGAGVFFIGYALFEVPSNLILARVGARLWITRIMITWGVLSIAMMYVNGPMSFYSVRFLLGVAEAGFLPGILYYLGNWFPATERAHAVSWFMLAIPLSSVVGGPLAGFILQLDGWHGLMGWQWLFLLEGAPAVVLGVVVWFYLTDTPEQAKWLTPEQRRWLAERVASEQRAANARHGIGLRKALLHPTVWLLAFILFAGQTASYGLTLWIPQIVKSLSGLANVRGQHDLGAAVRGRVHRHDRDRRELGSQRRTPAALGDSDRRRRPGFHRERVPDVAGTEHHRARLRGRRQHEHARAVLGAADSLSHGHSCGRWHRVDQHGGVGRWLRRALRHRPRA